MSTTYKLALGASVGVTTLIGLFSVMPGVLAATSSSTKNAVVTVGASCSMNSTVSTEHSASIAPGNYNKGIGLTEVTTTCNDAGGYAIYAVGYGDDTLGNNVLHSATVGSTYDIATGNDFANATSSYTSNTSQWAMRVETVPEQTDSPTITNNFDSLSLVPTTYTKVAQYNANTSTPSTSSITTEYGAYIAIGQPAGTYTGKVKYTLVHPSTEPAPTEGPTPPTSCTTPVPNLTYMQDLNSSNKATILANMTEDAQYYLADRRDDKTYCVAKLKDGNIWMTQNLDHDIVTDGSVTYDSTTTDLPANTTWSPVASTHASDDSEWGQYDEETNPDGGDTYHAESSDLGDLYLPAFADSDEICTALGGTWDIDDSKCYYTSNDSHYYLGNFYNHTAAIAMNYSGDYDGEYDPDTGGSTLVAGHSICPAGWTLLTEEAVSGLTSEYDSEHFWDDPLYFSIYDTQTQGSNYWTSRFHSEYMGWAMGYSFFYSYDSYGSGGRELQGYIRCYARD